MGNERARLPTIPHLVRYFFVLAALITFFYVQGIQPQISLPLIGPSLYLSYQLHHLIITYIWPLPASEKFLDYAFTVPVTFLYFIFIGILLKQLINERGKIRFLSLAALILFLAFIHFKAWKNLTGYLQAPESLTSPELRTR